MTRYAPLWQQNSSYPASVDRGLLSTLWPSSSATGGVVTTVSNTMNVSVALGTAAVALSSGAGSALCRWDAAEVVTHTAAPPSGQSRIDLVVLQVRDAVLDAGSNNDFLFQAIAGTPATTGSQVAPAVPSNSMAMCQVLVTGGTANLNGATITDVRPAGPMALGGPFAPPVAAGSPLVSRTDANGVMWVAKGGVYGGAWRQARDVLKASVTRLAAFNSTTSYTAFQFDTVAWDLYGMWGLTSVTVPVAGIYRVSSTISINPGAAGSYFATQVALNGTGLRAGGQMTNAVAGVPWLAPHVSAPIKCAAGDQLSVLQIGSTAMAGVVGQAVANWADFTYEGTG